MGGAGDDTITGDSGDDIIIGGKGLDEMSGGDGEDTFAFRSADEAPFDQNAVQPEGDTITDFSGSEGQNDVIDLVKVFKGPLTFLGEDAFTGTSGEVRVEDLRIPDTEEGVQQVLVDLDGDTVADMSIVVTSEFTLVEGDFNL